MTRRPDAWRCVSSPPMMKNDGHMLSATGTESLTWRSIALFASRGMTDTNYWRRLKSEYPIGTR